MKYPMLKRAWEGSEEYRRLCEDLRKGEGPIALFGLSEGPAMHMLSAVLDGFDGPTLLIAQDESEAMNIVEDMSALMSGVAYFPAREIQLQHYVAASRELNDRRIAVLRDLYKGEIKLCVCSVEAAMQTLAPREAQEKAIRTIALGEVVSLNNLPREMLLAGYERVQQISGTGQFRLSGGIFDVFPPGEKQPIRVEFFDDEVDSMRYFDLSSQRSFEKIECLEILAATEVPLDEKAIARAKKLLQKQLGLKEQDERDKRLKDRATELLGELAAGLRIEMIEAYLPFFYEPQMLCEQFPENAAFILLEPGRIEERAKAVHELYLQQMTQLIEGREIFSLQAEALVSAQACFAAFPQKRLLSISSLTRSFRFLEPKSLFSMELRSAAQYGAAIPMLAEDIAYLRKKETILIFAGKRAEKLHRDLEEQGQEAVLLNQLDREARRGEVLIIAQSACKGFEFPTIGLALFSEQDIYGSQKRKTKLKRKKQTDRMDLFAELKVGDYVVHEKYGIGVFKGIEKHHTADRVRDYLIIQYSGQDRLGVATDELDRVQKYIGHSENAPKLSKFGGAEWKKTVARARASVKELAFDLVALYAQRQALKGFAFSPDSLWQRQLEESFAYEETPGQVQSLEEIKRDMESERVMDRLLCGDVGYGKTEVALRAAFKAVQDSKQVAFLAPTTILVQQHYLTLKRRYEGFPVVVEMISRLRSPKQQRETLQRLKNGQIDLLVGTHRLLGKDIHFKDLGLLIVDEEQRFGVAHKEQIRNMKHNVDVLTLTATPIPRTLHMSMLGIRDMSVIDTPPEERYPVSTYVMEFNEPLIAEAIRKEIAHGGQCYLLYNHVSNMERFMGEMQKLVPEADFVMAHGQMRQGELEKTMLEFFSGEHDVLVCSTIIESGVDMPNVNTLIVFDADRFGLSQLYQIRGRVGRSNRKAYAYLTFRKDKVLQSAAEKRLRAIREFTEFGAGFKVALQDLEIRGAGNLIGPEQHGRMNEVGYDYFCKLIEEAVNEIRGELPKLQVDTQLDVAMSAFIAPEYIEDEAQRLEMYKRIASIQNEQDMLDVQEELIDRFGDMPEETEHLLDISLIKSYANMAQIEQIVLQKGQALLKFHPEARLDMDTLYGQVLQEPGWSFVPDKKCIRMKYQDGKADLKDIFYKCKIFLLKIMVCICVGD